MRATHSRFYEWYLESPAWADTRAEALEAAGHRCERCGARKYLEVHHKTYARLGYEEPEDLEVLCADCHAVADLEREEERHVSRP